MIRIHFPEKHPSVRNEPGKEMVFCICRKRWVSLTPEEWVRQNFLLYLNEVLHYPLKLIAVEKAVQVGEKKKRFDIVVYNTGAQPHLLVECKEMNVPLTEKTMMQVLSYHLSVKAAILVVTNGLHCFAFKPGAGSMEELKALPAFTR